MSFVCKCVMKDSNNLKRKTCINCDGLLNGNVEYNSTEELKKKQKRNLEAFDKLINDYSVTDVPFNYFITKPEEMFEMINQLVFEERLNEEILNDPRYESLSSWIEWNGGYN